MTYHLEYAVVRVVCIKHQTERRRKAIQQNVPDCIVRLKRCIHSVVKISSSLTPFSAAIYTVEQNQLYKNKVKQNSQHGRLIVNHKGLK